MKAWRAGWLRADAALLIVAAVWGFTFTAVQRALESASPFAFLSARFALAAVVLGAAFPRRVVRVTGRQLAVAALLGTWLTAGYALQTVGLLYTTASKSAFITGLSVVLVPLLWLLMSARFHDGRAGGAGLKPLVAAAIAAAGLYLLASPAGAGPNVGDLLTLGCAAGFALHIVTAGCVARRQDPAALAFWQIVATALACAALMSVLETPRLALTLWTLAALVVTGVLATAFAFATQMWAQRETSATHVALIFAAEPVFAAVFAHFVQGDRLGLRGIAGGALILAGIAVAQLWSVRPRPR